MAASGRIGGYTGVAATDPATASGAGSTTGDPATGAKTERGDGTNSNGGQINVGVFDAIKSTAGATGAVSVTHATSSRQAMIVAAFKANA